MAHQSPEHTGHTSRKMLPISNKSPCQNMPALPWRLIWHQDVVPGSPGCDGHKLCWPRTGQGHEGTKEILGQQGQESPQCPMAGPEGAQDPSAGTKALSWVFGRSLPLPHSQCWALLRPQPVPALCPTAMPLPGPAPSESCKERGKKLSEDTSASALPTSTHLMPLA